MNTLEVTSLRSAGSAEVVSPAKELDVCVNMAFDIQMHMREVTVRIDNLVDRFHAGASPYGPNDAEKLDGASSRFKPGSLAAQFENVFITLQDELRSMRRALEVLEKL